MNQPLTNLAFRVLTLTVIAAAAPAAADTIAEPTGPDALVAGIGDLDNDKELDLVVLQPGRDAFRPIVGGSHLDEIETDAGAVDLCVVDLDIASYAAGDEFCDVVVLTRDLKSNTSRVHIWINQGLDASGEWQGFPETPIVLEFKDAAFDSLAAGDFIGSDGWIDLFLFDESSRNYSAARNDGESSGVWKKMTGDRVWPLASGDSLETILAPDGRPGFFILLDAKNTPRVKTYSFGGGL